MTDATPQDIQIHAAIDLGASSGRVIAGWIEDGKIQLREIHRFENIQQRIAGHDCWNLDELFSQAVIGLGKIPEVMGKAPTTIGVDTWGLDYVLLDNEDKPLAPSIAHRDARTEGMPEVADSLLDPARTYSIAGIQRMAINTSNQLIAHLKETPEQLAQAATFLMVGDYLNFRLTGIKACEYTNASTTGLLDAKACQWSDEIIAAYGLPRHIILDVTMPGGILGNLRPEIAEQVGYDAQVVLTATHDTGSAYLAVPAQGNAAFLSSGTWSLMGTESLVPVLGDQARAMNFTNEGGYEKRYRILKNIMGLWMSQSVRREVNGVTYVNGTQERQAMFDHKVGFGELADLAREAEPFEAVVNVDDDRFLSPASMIEEIKAACRDTNQPVPETIGQVMRVIYLSLPESYRRCVADLDELTGTVHDSINIVGGGCQDDYLNQMTANICKVPVYAGPVEATSLGNLTVQFIASGELASLEEARSVIRDSFDVRRFDPQEV